MNETKPEEGLYTLEELVPNVQEPRVVHWGPAGQHFSYCGLTNTIDLTEEQARGRRQCAECVAVKNYINRMSKRWQSETPVSPPKKPWWRFW